VAVDPVTGQLLGAVATAGPGRRISELAVKANWISGSSPSLRPLAATVSAGCWSNMSSPLPDCAARAGW
jgi:hypothetical protein